MPFTTDDDYVYIKIHKNNKNIPADVLDGVNGKPLPIIPWGKKPLFADIPVTAYPNIARWIHESPV